MSEETPKAEPDDEPEYKPRRGADREVTVGLFVIVGVIAAVGLLYTLTDAAIFRGRYIVITNVQDAGGIRKGDPVQMRGVNIGRILRFKLVRTPAGAVQGVDIQLEVEGEYHIPKDSRVHLRSAGLLGSMIAEIIPGTAAEDLHYHDRLPGDSAAQGDVIGDMQKQVQVTLTRVNDLLNTKFVEDVHGATAEMRATMTELRGTIKDQRIQLSTLQASLQRSATGFEQVTTNFKDTSANAREASASAKTLLARPELDQSMKRLDTFTAKLDEASASFKKAADSMAAVTARAEAGEGSLGKLTKDDALYNNLNEAAANLSKLSEDIRRNPKKYIDLKVF
jgi:phospholipid/cholesterol/gamma-HCH transport system substrate-binding protein